MSLFMGIFWKEFGKIAMFVQEKEKIFAISWLTNIRDIFVFTEKKYFENNSNRLHYKANIYKDP